MKTQVADRDPSRSFYGIKMDYYDILLTAEHRQARSDTLAYLGGYLFCHIVLLRHMGETSAQYVPISG